MQCKFKPILNIENTLNIHSSLNAANDAVCALLERVSTHMQNRKVQEKSKHFLNNKLINMQVDSVKQVYQTSPRVPSHFVEELTPVICMCYFQRIHVRQCLRPMSAQVKYQSSKASKSPNRNSIIIESKKTILSHASKLSTGLHKRPMTASSSTIAEQTTKKRRYQKKPPNTQKKFFAIKTSYDIQDSFIDQLRIKKVMQEEQIKKKQQFLKSIEFQSKNFVQSQSKFIQTMSRKKFIYGQHGEVIEIGSNAGSAHLKRVAAMGKSRVQIKQKPQGEIKNMIEQGKQNIYVEFKGRQGFDTRPQTAKPTIKGAQNKLQVPSAIQKIQSTTRLSQKPKIVTNNYLIEVKPPKIQTSQKNLSKQSNLPSQSVSPLRTQKEISLSTDLRTQEKKVLQKFYFYPSSNSVYRVVDDGFNVVGEDNAENNVNNDNFIS